MNSQPINLNPKVNELIPFTRRYPDLPKKVLQRDSKIAKRLIEAWDTHHDGDLVLDIFLKEQRNLSDYRYWEMLKLVWAIAGSTDRLPIFLPLLQSTRKQRHYFMTPEEHKRLRELPEVLTVYRAHNIDSNGISWTLSRDYAERFKEMHDKQMISIMTIHRSSIFALVERIGEEEVLILGQ